MSETVQGGQARGDSRKAPRAGRFQSTSLDDFVFGGGGATESVDGDADGPAAEPMLDVPDVRQSTDWDCGACAFLSVAKFFGVDGTEEEFISLLGSNPEHGTEPDMIVNAGQELGLRPMEFANDIDGVLLDKYIAAGHPVIVCMQLEDDAGVDAADKM